MVRCLVKYCPWADPGLWYRLEDSGAPGLLEGLGVDVFLPGVPLGRFFFLVQDGAGTFALSLGSLEY